MAAAKGSGCSDTIRVRWTRAGVSRTMSVTRRKSVVCDVGGVPVGGDRPIVVQSMTNTDTADSSGTVNQVMSLARAGSELVRVTVNHDKAAAALPRIAETADTFGVHVPIGGAL